MNKKKIYPQYFLILGVGIYTLLFIIPTINGFYYSLTNWNVMNDTMTFIGLENYKEIFIVDRTLLQFIGNTFVFAIATTVLKTVFGFMLAVLFNKGLRNKNIFRAIFFIPVVLSPLIIGLIFTSIFHPEGIINAFLHTVGLDAGVKSWLVDPNTAMGSVISVEAWRYTGFNMVIYLAGMQSIAEEYYEAAAIDGASNWQQLIHITVPLIMPAITINIILNMINGLKVFDLVYVLTGGGPGHMTGVLSTAVFDEFSNGRYGLGTAIGVIIFVLTSIIAFALLRVMKAKEADLQ